jgi:hypothetical protein
VQQNLGKLVEGTRSLRAEKPWLREYPGVLREDGCVPLEWSTPFSGKRDCALAGKKKLAEAQAAEHDPYAHQGR